MHVGFARLEVNVARTLGGRPLDYAVHQAHGRRALRIGIVAERRGCERGRLVARLDFALHLFDGARGTLVAVQRHDGALDRIVGRHHRHHAFARCGLHRLDSKEVERIAHGQENLFGSCLDRHNAVRTRDILRDDPAHLRIDIVLGKIDELDAELHLQSLDKLRFGNDALVDEDLAQSAVRALLVRKSQIELIVADQPRIYK